MTIGCFIDYDNLKELNKRNGLLDTVTRIVENIDFDRLDSLNRMFVRLYGGWYDESANLTNTAQAISSSEIQEKFPAILNRMQLGTIKKINCSVELAFSLLEVPGDLLHSTFRQKSGVPRFKCYDSDSLGCSIPNCFANDLNKALRRSKCIEADCTNKITDLIYRHEQKMVDTLLTCDIQYGSTIYDLIIIVSSDDDFVPVIKSLLNRQKSIMHVETKPSYNQINNKFSLGITSITL